MLDQAALGYQDLQKAGQGITTATNAPITNLLSQFALNAGIASPVPQQNQANNPNAPQGPVTVGGVPQGQQHPAGAPGTSAANPNTYGQGVQQPQQQGPYALSQPQQQQLNQSIDRINKQAQTDIASVTQSLASKGITDPRAVAAASEQLKEHYNQMASETSTQFYNQIQQQKQSEIEALLKSYEGLQQQGLSGLTQVGQIHEQTAQQQSAAFGNVINDLLGGVGSIAGLVTGVPGGGGSSGGSGGSFDYGSIFGPSIQDLTGVAPIGVGSAGGVGVDSNPYQGLGF